MARKAARKPNWYVDEGLQRLIGQWRVMHPGAIVGTLGDAAHRNEDSEHNPEVHGPLPGQDTGEVDAGDFMPGNGVTIVDLADLRSRLLAGRDPRILYLIWHDIIVSSVVQPWVPRHYSGAWHNHLHVSVNDRYDNNPALWDLGEDNMDQKQFNTLMHGFLATKEGKQDMANVVWNGPAWPVEGGRETAAVRLGHVDEAVDIILARLPEAPPEAPAE